MVKLIQKAYIAISLMTVLVCSISAQEKESELQNFVRSNVLGTSFEMSINAPVEQANRAEKAVIDEIKRLEHIFSTYDKNSEVSQLNQTKKSRDNGPSSELITVIKQCEYWQKQLPKSFSCRLGKVIEMWQSLERDQQRPERSKIREIARAALRSDFSLDDLVADKSNKDFYWDFGGIAKGYILDSAMAVAKSVASSASEIKIDIGGDGVYWQQADSKQSDWLVGLANPIDIDDSHEKLLGTFALNDGAIAFSGHASRARIIARRSYSHILAPRDGWPTHNPVTAIVKAPDATTADALATAFAVSDISVTLDWLHKHQDYAALLIDSDGRQYASSNWYQHYQQAHENSAQPANDYQAKISFSLPLLNVAEYRKPYVALWVADDKGKVVKNLLILGQSERWMQENRSWWRIQGRKSPQLLDGFARPTRRPGQYNVIWNGRDDFGKQLPSGQYRVYAEVAREHGEYEKIFLAFELGKQEQTVRKKGKEEINLLTFQTYSTLNVGLVSVPSTTNPNSNSN